MLSEERFVSGETADVVIIGGGVIGLAVARALALHGGVRVTLIERARLGAEASFAAAGMLAAQAEADCADSFLELACRSRDLYTEFADALLEETGINIEHDRSGTLYLAFNEDDEREINHRYEWQRRADLPVERLTGDEARELEPCVSGEVRSALRFPLDAQVENRRLLAALAVAAQKLGVRFLTSTNVESLLVERGRIKGVETASGKVYAPAVVVACGAWASFLGSKSEGVSVDVQAQPGSSGIRIEPVRGQILCFESQTRLARHVIYSPRGYIVPRLDGRLLAGSTTEYAGFDKRVTIGGIHLISRHALEIAPVIESLPLVDLWAGLRPRAEDDLPVLGACEHTRGLFYAAGHYRNGILLAPLTGELIAELILTNRTSPQLSAFSPSRFQYAGASQS
jgi:glycine oxidase